MRNVIWFFLMIITFNSCATTNYPSNRSVSSNNNSVSNSTNDFEALMIKDKVGRDQRISAVATQLMNDLPILPSFL